MSYIGSTPTTQSFIAGTDQFTGNGSTTSWTLSRFVNSTNDIEVVIANVVQNPTSYSISGNTLTVSPAISNGVTMYVRYISTTLQSTAPSQGTVTTTTIADGAVTTAKLSTGAPTWDSSGNLTPVAQIRGTATSTPPRFADSAGTQIGTLCRAWVNFNGSSGASPVIRASFNVSSVTRTGAGLYTITFSNAMPDVNYSIIGMCGANAASNGYGLVANSGGSLATTTTYPLRTINNLTAVDDNSYVYVAFFR